MFAKEENLLAVAEARVIRDVDKVAERPSIRCMRL